MRCRDSVYFWFSRVFRRRKRKYYCSEEVNEHFDVNKIHISCKMSRLVEAVDHASFDPDVFRGVTQSVNTYMTNVSKRYLKISYKSHLCKPKQ